MPEKIKAAPIVVYPESDGKPMEETEYHRDIMIDFIQKEQVKQETGTRQRAEAKLAEALAELKRLQGKTDA